MAILGYTLVVTVLFPKGFEVPMTSPGTLPALPASGPVPGIWRMCRTPLATPMVWWSMAFNTTREAPIGSDTAQKGPIGPIGPPGEVKPMNAVPGWCWYMLMVSDIEVGTCWNLGWPGGFLGMNPPLCIASAVSGVPVLWSSFQISRCLRKGVNW